jgi:Bacterial Ig domain
MPTSAALVQRIRLVRTRARLAMCVRGIAWLIVLVGGFILLAGVGDHASHFDNPAIRLALLAGICAATVFAAWRLVLVPLFAPLSDIALAGQVEELFPGFEERLASALQFQQANRDGAIGSPDLQEKVIAEALHKAEGLDFRKVVTFVPAVPGVATAACLALVAAGLVWTSPTETRIALRRLFTPFSAPSWPRKTNLQLLTLNFQPVATPDGSPLKVVRGRKLELLVEDSHGRLPDEVLLEYRLPDEPALHETLRHASLRDGQGKLRDVCLVSLPADRGPVWFRAIGGDDQTMAEYEMRVVLPPALESLKVRVTPPRYIARAATTLPPGEGRIRGVVGTHVDFEARATKPLASADLTVRGKTVAAMTVLPDRLTFRGGFDLAEAGTYAYSFKFKDSEGVDTVDPPRYEIEAIADQVPQVTIDAPAADATVTANAQIPVTVTAKDDWGLRDLQLRFRVGENLEANAPTVALATGLPRSEHHRASMVWPLGGLGVSEGMRIVFRAEATDWFDLGPPHVGKSLPRVLTIVSAKQKEAEIVSRQADLLRILERAEHVQSQTTDQTRDLDVQLEKAGRLRPADLDILKRVQSDQRRINDVLASPSDGAASAVRGLLDELRQNHIASPKTRERLERFDRELSELGRSHLAAVDNHLATAVKRAELASSAGDNAARPEQAKSLKAARREQGVVLESLRSMLGDLAQWRDWQDIHESMRELVDVQEKLNGDTADLSRTTFAKPLSELTKQEQADLSRMAERESQLADQVERLAKKLRDAADGMQTSNREAARNAAATLKSLEGINPQARMREIGGQLAQNNVGRAMAQQQELLEQLRKLDRTFSERPESDLQSLVARMAEAGQRIDALTKDQEKLLKRTRELAQRQNAKNAKPELEELRKEQNRLAESTDDAARELRRLGAEAPTENLRQAGSHMSQAEEHLQKGRSASADAQQKQALDELNRAAAALNQSKKKAGEQLARQSLVRVADQLEGLAARQKSVIDETKRLDSERAQIGHMTRGQLRSLQSLAEIERQTREEAARIADELQNADVYQWALRRGVGSMQEAAERLGTQFTDPKTVAVETDAWSRLRELAQLLKPDASASANGGNEQNAGTNPGGGSDGVPIVAQLKLLKSLEEDLVRRTQDLDRRRQEKTDRRSESEGDVGRLAAEQGELAALIRQFVERMAKSPNPSKSESPAKGR